MDNQSFQTKSRSSIFSSFGEDGGSTYASDLSKPYSVEKYIRLSVQEHIEYWKVTSKAALVHDRFKDYLQFPQNILQIYHIEKELSFTPNFQKVFRFQIQKKNDNEIPFYQKSLMNYFETKFWVTLRRKIGMYRAHPNMREKLGSADSKFENLVFEIDEKNSKDFNIINEFENLAFKSITEDFDLTFFDIDFSMWNKSLIKVI
ncbi:hypothetical protein ROZALSC1DRAFT_20578 [Rozella allomycis CSF55]|uniref:Uncharacterized protein n=1 Tax=Rozella allomycis (strain CSF55) TaxID=988480 RepID=A0A4P9YPD3_ROZAC|nr:hypothetical protein ROZALSC1DRAFT_20578 [Rozella allomycis CSF55]